jgi:hypothetical protein
MGSYYSPHHLWQGVTIDSGESFSNFERLSCFSRDYNFYSPLSLIVGSRFLGNSNTDNSAILQYWKSLFGMFIGTMKVVYEKRESKSLDGLSY